MIVRIDLAGAATPATLDAAPGGYGHHDGYIEWGVVAAPGPRAAAFPGRCRADGYRQCRAHRRRHRYCAHGGALAAGAANPAARDAHAVCGR